MRTEVIGGGPQGARAKAQSSPPATFNLLITIQVGQEFHYLKSPEKLSGQWGVPHPFEHPEILVERGLVLDRRAVDALELRVELTNLVVGAGHGGELERASASLIACSRVTMFFANMWLALTSFFSCSSIFWKSSGEMRWLSSRSE